MEIRKLMVVLDEWLNLLEVCIRIFGVVLGRLLIHKVIEIRKLILLEI
jgi:hypothetical protein